MRTEFLHYTALGRVAKSDRSLPCSTRRFHSIAEAVAQVVKTRAWPPPPSLGRAHSPAPAQLPHKETSRGLGNCNKKRAGPLKRADLLY